MIKKSRLIFVYSCILVVFLAIILRMVLIVSSGDKIKIRGIYDLSKIVKRGDIVDRNGVLVATDLKTKSLYVSNILIKDKELVARGISNILGDPNYQEVLKKITDDKEKRNWVLIKRSITPTQEEKLQNLKIAGLLFEDDSIRVYPQKSIASHIVGYVDPDRKGLAGIEMAYDKKLANNQQKIELALDVRVQDVLNDELVKAMADYKAKAVAGLVVDVTNGEILALSSIPNFDPNLQNEADPDQRFNRITTGVYEFGSIFKIFTNANAFDDNLIKTTDNFYVGQPVKYGRFSIKDDHYVKDWLTTEEVFAYSSNIGTIEIAKKIGIQSQRDFLKKMHLLQKSDAEFPGIGRPIYPSASNWSEISLYTIAFGHGIAITPLQLISGVSAIVNGGILYPPSFLKLSKKPDGQRVIKESTSEIMRKMMRKVALDGTGRFANVEGYEVAGKTGTAERAEFGAYSHKKTLASFAAIFPISDPKYLVFVMIDRANMRFNTGGMIAAPLAGRIVKNIAPIVELAPIDNKKTQ
jgi:cell division protein FtsI (penicillin-binding protein 3)